MPVAREGVGGLRTSIGGSHRVIITHRSECRIFLAAFLAAFPLAGTMGAGGEKEPARLRDTPAPACGLARVRGGSAVFGAGEAPRTAARAPCAAMWAGTEGGKGEARCGQQHGVNREAFGAGGGV